MQPSVKILSSLSSSEIASWLLQSNNDGRNWRRRYFNYSCNLNTITSSKEPFNHHETIYQNKNIQMELRVDNIISIKPSLKCTRCIEIIHINKNGTILKMYLRASKLNVYEEWYHTLLKKVNKHRSSMYSVTKDPELLDFTNINKLTIETLDLYRVGALSHSIPSTVYNCATNNSSSSKSSGSNYNSNDQRAL